MSPPSPFLRGTLTASLSLLAGLPFARGAETQSRPNILLVFTEDWSLDLGCYGNHELKTPNLDAFAKEGRLYRMAFCTSPVCSPSRSAMMTGFHQHTIAAQEHRTAKKKPLPAGIAPVPHLLEAAGYYTCLLDGKTDCNFTTEKRLFMGKDWKNRAPGQPFFAQYTIGVTHRTFHRDPENPIDPAKVTLPPYYPDTPLVRRDWANGYESMQVGDRLFGKIMQRLKDEKLADNTLVIFAGDNGLCHARAKQFLYEDGIHVPLLVRWPGHIAAGEETAELTSTLDIPATILAAAGVKPQKPLQGRDMLNGNLPPREAVFASRDLMDMTYDVMRCVREKRYKLIHNLLPDRPWAQYNEYKESQYPAWDTLHLFKLEGKLTPEQALFMAKTKPEFELYDMEKDPNEFHNLADDPAFRDVKTRLIARLNTWRKETGDPGVNPVMAARTLQNHDDDIGYWRKRVATLEAKIMAPAKPSDQPSEE